MPSLLRNSLFTILAMLAFAGNSLLCRQALARSQMDAASFTAIRLLAGALMLLLIVLLQNRSLPRAGSWRGAAALFVYAAAFSFAYLSLPAATGALALFGAVQVSMISYASWQGEHLRPWQWLGFAAALAGLLLLLWPGVAAPSPLGLALMLLAGIAWGVYSLLGRGAGDATAVTAGNFLRATPLGLLLLLWQWPAQWPAAEGVAYAIASGALTSGLGYALWYRALKGLSATVAASVQLSVPLLTALLAWLWLAESPGWRLAWASLAILGGIALVIAGRRPR